MVEKMRENGYHLDWRALKSDWPLWLVMTLILALAVAVYPHLPERVPAHWNIYGQVDRYTTRAMGAFMAPLLNLGIYLMMLFIPLIDPKRDNYTRFARAYRMVRWGTVLILSLLYLVTIAAAVGYRVNVGMMVKSLVAILFIIIGNLLGQIRFNYFVGVRTPWTLSSEEVWQRTHRLSGKVWVLGGLICLGLAPANTLWSAIAYFACMAAMVLIPTIYSYLVYARTNRV